MSDEILIIILALGNIILLVNTFYPIFQRNGDIDVIGHISSLIEMSQKVSIEAIKNAEAQEDDSAKEFFEGMHDGAEFIRYNMFGGKNKSIGTDRGFSITIM